MADNVLVRRVFNFICSSGGFVELSGFLRHDSPLRNSKTELEVRKQLMTHLCRAGSSCRFVAVTDCKGEIAGVRIDFGVKMCHEYCDKGSCEKEQGKCKFWHICKGFLEGSCFGECCRSHDFYDKDNKAKTKFLGVEIFPNGTVRNAVAWSLPQVCQLYLRHECRSDNCPYLHVCYQAVKGAACDGRCILSHTLRDHHNNKVLHQYDMVAHDAMKPGFLRCNILVQIRKEQRVFHNRICTCVGQATNEGLSQLGDSATTELPSEKGSISPKRVAVDDLCDQGTHSISNVTISEQTELEGAFKLRMESEKEFRNFRESKLLPNKRTKPTSEGLSDTSAPQPNTKSYECQMFGGEGNDSCLNSSACVQQECKARKESKNLKKCGRDSRTHHPPWKNSLDDRDAIRQQESKKSVSICELDSKRKDEDEVKVPGFNKTSTESKHHSLEEPKVAKRNPRTSKTTTKCLERAGKGDGPKGNEINRPRPIKVCNEFAPQNLECLQKSGQQKCTTMSREGSDCAITGQLEKAQKDTKSAHLPSEPNTKISFGNDSKRGINGSKMTVQILNTAAADRIEEQTQDLESAKANSKSKPLSAHLTSESHTKVLLGNDSKRRSKGSKMTTQILDTESVSKSAKGNRESKPLSIHFTSASDTKVLQENDPMRRSKGSKMTAQVLMDTESVSKSAKANSEPKPLSAHLTSESNTKVLPGNDPKRKSKMTTQIPDTETVSKSAKVNNKPNLLSAHFTNESDTNVLPGNGPKRRSKSSKMTAQIPDTEGVSKSAKVNNEPYLLSAHLTHESDTKVLPGNDPKRKSKMTTQIADTETVSKSAKVKKESDLLSAHLTNESDTNVLPGNDLKRRSKGSKMTAQILDTESLSKSATVNNEPIPLSEHCANESDTKVFPGNGPKRRSKSSKVTVQIPDTESVSKSAKVNKAPNLLSAHLTNESDTKVLPGNDPKRRSKGSKMIAQIPDTESVSKSAKVQCVNNEPTPLRAHLTNESDTKVLPGNGPKRRSKSSKMTAQILDTENVSKSAKVNNERNLLSAHLTSESDTNVLPGNDPKRKSKMTTQIVDTETVSQSAKVNKEPNLLSVHLTNESDTNVLPGNDLKRRSKSSKVTAQIPDTASVSKIAKVNKEPNLLSVHLTNESETNILPGNDLKRRSKSSKVTAQIPDTASVSKSAKVNKELNLLSAHLTNESDTNVLPGNDLERRSKNSKVTTQIPDTASVSKSAKVNKELNLLRACLTNESDTKVLPGNDPKRRSKSSKMTAQILDTENVSKSAKVNNEPNMLSAHLTNESDTKVLPGNDPKRRSKSTKASKNSAQGSNKTKESARSPCKPVQPNNTSLGGNDSKRREESSKMITRSSHMTAVRNIEELKQDLESASYKENYESKPNHLQDETAAKKSVQKAKMTKKNEGRSAWKQKFDSEIENFACNSHGESAQKRFEISCDTRDATSANNTLEKPNQMCKQTMKILECVAPDGLMQDLTITEGAKTLLTNNNCDLQSQRPSKGMEAEISHQELSYSNSCHPTSLTSDVSLKMKVFECLCKEYNCSASFAMISKRTDLFPCGFKDIKSWFQKNGNRFRIIADEHGEILEVDAYSSRARLCCNYNRVGECRRENCEYLHICKDYVTNSCSHGAFCPWNHHFQDKRDKALLSRVRLDMFTDEQLCKLVLSSSPQVCVAYNNGICDRGNLCKGIHICSDHLKKTCRKESRCGLDHESAMNTEHTESVLKRYHLDHLHSHLLKQIILVSDQLPKASKIDVPICSDFLLGICEKGFYCQAHHCPLPFHWQYRITKDNEWKSFSKEDNEKLEKLYCDVTLNDCSAAGFHISFERGESFLLKEAHEVRFLLDKMVMVLEDESEIIADLRRLSTPSDVTDPGSAVAMHWIWYWEECDEIWREYSQDDMGRDLQRALEEAFLNSRNRFRFRLVGQEYALSFAPTLQMSETSLKLGSARIVRRRPARVISKDDIAKLKRSHIFLPLSWRNKTRSKMPRNWTAVPSDREFKRISLPPHSAEFREMEKVFSKSIKCSVVITNIEKVQVPLMWKKYKRRKGFKPGVKARGSNRKFLTERQLAHGTRTAEEKSCKQDLDWCSAYKYVCTFSRKEHQRVRRRKLLRLDFL